MRRLRVFGWFGLTFALAWLLSSSGLSIGQASGFQNEDPAGKIEPGLRESVAAESKGAYWIDLVEQADLDPAYAIADWDARGEFVYRTLLETARGSQADLIAFLESEVAAGNVDSYRSFFINNSILVTSNVDVLDAAAARSDVLRLRATRTFPVPDLTPAPALEGPLAIEWGVSRIRSPEIWSAFGTTGAGVVVGNIDTGVAYTHAALVNKYRGNLGGGNFNHSFNWYDATNLCSGTAPCDQNNHGTHTMGTMVGDDGGSNQIGNAPGAVWIAARGCESNFCSDAALTASWQWMVAPCALGDDPGAPSCSPSQRPNVLNYSIGGPGGDPSDQPLINAARAAGIVLSISAGNSGPGSNTVGSPGDYCNVIGVGATDINDVIAGFSSRGPGNFNCGEPQLRKPDVSAPGVSVRSSIANGSYANFNGTSMAAPHVAGCAALLLGIDISTTHDEIFDALTSTAIDLGTAGYDFNYGYGRIDCFAAAQFLFPPGTPVPTSTPPPTPTSTPNPAAVHVGDLDGSGTPTTGGRWNASITITVLNQNGTPVSGATVTGSWSNGANGNANCTTGATGQCTVAKNKIKGSVNSVTFTVTAVNASGFSYNPAANADPDGDSNGTVIVVAKP